MDQPLLDRIAAAVRESQALHQSFFASESETIVRAAHAIAAAFASERKLLLFGNGGSAADAQHIAAEFVNKLGRPRKALAALALTTDSSALTSIGNDMSFNEIFSRQVEALGVAGDVVIGITTSGNSGNVLEALKVASEKGLITLGFLGRDGGKALSMCQFPIVVPHTDTQRIQELHIMIGHLLAELSEEIYLGPEGRT